MNDLRVPIGPVDTDGEGTRTVAASTGAVTIDVVIVLALTAVALIGLDDSYATRAYLATGMVGAGAMVAWALLCTVQSYGAGVFLLVASIGFPVLGASVALHDFDWLGFPSFAGMLDLLTATITAPSEFLTTIPPVDAVGTVLAIPYVIGYVLGGSAPPSPSGRVVQPCPSHPS